MKRYRVLVVEDDIALAGLYQAALRFAGFDVELVGDGLSALWHIEAERPDVIVLDLSLPQLRGEAVLTELASSPDLYAVPVVVVTGSDCDQAVMQASAVLRKPCDPFQLLSVIRRVCPSAPEPPATA